MTALNIFSPSYPKPTDTYTYRTLNEITDLVIHHSGGPKTQTPAEIDAYLRTLGDIYMAYTWLIDNNGAAYVGRPALAMSAATFGRNYQSVSICMIGNFQTDSAGYNGPPSEAALNTLYALSLRAHILLPAIVRTYAHRDVAKLFYDNDSNYATECCGNELNTLLPAIKSKVYANLRKR